MSRHARLEAPETLQQVIVRGIERTALFRDDGDRADCVARLAALRGRSRVPAAVRGRHLLAYLWVEQCGPRARADPG